jgi:hypothetical protein
MANGEDVKQGNNSVMEAYDNYVFFFFFFGFGFEYVSVLDLGLDWCWF